MRSAKKAISIITLFCLLLSTNYSICLGAMLPPTPAPLSIIQDAVTLPEAKVGVAYEYLFQSEGGLAPLTWRVTQGELPSGLILETNGKLHGKLSQARREAFAFLIEVSDSSNVPQRFTQPFLLTVQAAPLRIVAGGPKLRIVTKEPPKEQVINNSQSGSQNDTQFADVSTAAFTEVRSAASPTAMPTPAQLQAPNLKTPLIVGSKKIEGTATAAGDVTITITSNDKSKLTSPPLPLTDGKFSFTLTKALALGDEVKAGQGSGAQLISSVPVQVEKTPLMPAQFTQPKVGVLQIEAVAKSGQELRVLVDGNEISLNQNGTSTKAWSAQAGTNIITLKDPLQGEKIALKIVDPTDGREVISTEVPIKDAPPLYNWGRVRAYFAAGVIFSKERNSFSQQDLMLSFHLDKNWWNASATSKSPIKHFNTFFDTRLTSIPVVTTPTPTPTPATGGTTTSTSTSTQSVSNQQCNDIAAGGLDCFLASRKVAVMQVGGYMPIYSNFMKWRFDDHDNVVFFAPLAKFGIQTITSEEVSQRNSANNNSQNEILNGDSVYNFFNVGTRLGHYKLSADPNVAPELISYLDLTAGKWENFDLTKGQPCTAPANSGEFKCDKNGSVKLGDNLLFIRERKFRLGFEGRLKIPETPLFVGFDANLGKGPDDLRFLFGTRFDIGNLFGRLKYLQSLNK